MNGKFADDGRNCKRMQIDDEISIRLPTGSLIKSLTVKLLKAFA